jgi:hypothetical protein
MIKVSLFEGETEAGPAAVPLFGPADSTFEKVASPRLLPAVARYIQELRPIKDSIYVLVNAMGASEYFGSNVNGDAFPEAALIHAPEDWKGIPTFDREISKTWPYGYPTFYLAHPYAHHRNKDATRAFGEVELAVWNPHMKRVELVTRVDKEKCYAFGGVGVWDKLAQGLFPDVSMGTKVPFDTCSICLDWKRYREAQATFDKSRHKSPGDAVLEVHKKKPIRGVSITRKDYCEHARTMMNKILPDGRKVFVFNDYPRFFDISFVFIGADRTAKTMMKIAHERKFWSIGSAEVAEKLGYIETSTGVLATFNEWEEKIAADPIAAAFGHLKEGEISKNVIPSHFAAKAVPMLTKEEKDLPKDIIETLGSEPLERALSTSTCLGIVLRPREFQRIILIQVGRRDLADHYDKQGVVFPKTEDSEDVPMGPDAVHPLLARVLSSVLEARSGLGPFVEQRVVVVSKKPSDSPPKTTSHSSTLLRKIGAAYNGYRKNVMDLVAHSQEVMTLEGMPSDGHKLASAPVDDVFTPLSVAYLHNAFWDEVGTADGNPTSSVERGSPSRNTSDSQSKAGGQS